MARLSKKYAALPTHKLRNKVWARAVKQNLLPDSDPARPYSHLICDALNARRVDQGKVSLGQFFTPTRWLDWWNGAHPTPGKQKAIDTVVNGSARWFEAHIAESNEHPLHTLLHAMDLVGKPVNDMDSFEVLVGMQKKWGPSRRILGQCQWGAWYLPQFPNTKIPMDIATRHYSALAPASIIRYMLWMGDAMHIAQTPQYRAWVFDLVSASMCVFAIYSVRGANSMFLSGTDGDVAAFVFRIFTRHDLSNAAELDRLARNITNSIEGANRDEPVFPTGDGFAELMTRSVTLFTNELKLFGISVTEIDLRDHGCFANKIDISGTT